MELRNLHWVCIIKQFLIFGIWYISEDWKIWNLFTNYLLNIDKIPSFVESRGILGVIVFLTKSRKENGFHKCFHEYQLYTSTSESKSQRRDISFTSRFLERKQIVDQPRHLFNVKNSQIQSEVKIVNEAMCKNLLGKNKATTLSFSSKGFKNDHRSFKKYLDTIFTFGKRLCANLFKMWNHSSNNK